MTQRILVMGLPGAGKTTFAKELAKKLNAFHFNADEVRKQHNDWDFSLEGRNRQAERMKKLCTSSGMEYAIADFVAPLTSMRFLFEPHWTIWIDTIEEGRFEDTNKIFEKPETYDFRITEQNAEYWAEFVYQKIIKNERRPKFDEKKETVQMLGRWQPWHKGHRALFERALKKTGQVCIMIRNCQGWNNSNPFDLEEVKKYIEKDLEPLYQGMYKIMVVPNIVNITYGRDVGYKIEQEVFDDSVHSISATKIREKLGFK